MTAVPEKVLNWLYSVLPSEYTDVNRTYHDVVETLSHYPSLSPRTEVYTYENGASALLLLLSGTLPVTFRGATYGFPVAIWIPHAYPRESPIVYVTPSQDMLVRPGQHVSGEGRIYHPYLAQWGKYWDKSTIFDFLAVLRGVFAKEPPLRSKQAPVNATAAPTPPPVPPPPPEWRRSVQGSHGPSSSPGPTNQESVPPPKPPKPYENTGGTLNPPAQLEDRYSRPPPLPPHPPQPQEQRYRQPSRDAYGGPSHGQQHRTPPGAAPSTGYDMQLPAPGPMQPQAEAQNLPSYQRNSYEIGSPVSPITPDDRYRRPAPLPQPAQRSASQQYQPAPPHPQPHSRYPPAPAQYAPPAQGYPHPQPPYQAAQPVPPVPKPPVNLIDDPLEVTLPSQAKDQPAIPVPPVPPNPEKDALLQALSQTLCAQIRQTVTSNTSALAPLRSQQAALQTAYWTLQNELHQVQELDAALASNEKILQETMREADRVMEEARTRKVPDVDDVLVAPTVVGGQLYNLAAEERAIADALFVLGKALDRGRVGADVFVKQTRSLAREQFLKKALIKKIAKGLALDEFPVR
ncbi:UEV-domain-containing protein [Westerdykella ornata]|uniref:UEV-domain-containing protein n=1 Tax=Westerdykella ornata TaxID=318751 RepID=A0A6A6JRX5_WESOR|nr:UEV-domain-containing protein [Westerdykella ornata]KAF2278863.1 UEV-domain-containing protein [Westerdykella ornata]